MRGKEGREAGVPRGAGLSRCPPGLVRAHPVTINSKEHSGCRKVSTTLIGCPTRVTQVT